MLMGWLCSPLKSAKDASVSLSGSPCSCVSTLLGAMSARECVGGQFAAKIAFLV